MNADGKAGGVFDRKDVRPKLLSQLLSACSRSSRARVPAAECPPCCVKYHQYSGDFLPCRTKIPLAHPYDAAHGDWQGEAAGRA